MRAKGHDCRRFEYGIFTLSNAQIVGSRISRCTGLTIADDSFARRRTDPLRFIIRHYGRGSIRFRYLSSNIISLRPFHFTRYLP